MNELAQLVVSLSLKVQVREVSDHLELHKVDNAILHTLPVTQADNADEQSVNCVRVTPQTQHEHEERATFDKLMGLLVRELHDSHGVANLRREHQVQRNEARQLDHKDHVRVRHGRILWSHVHLVAHGKKHERDASLNDEGRPEDAGALLRNQKELLLILLEEAEHGERDVVFLQLEVLLAADLVLEVDQVLSLLGLHALDQLVEAAPVNEVLLIIVPFGFVVLILRLVDSLPMILFS